MFDCIAQMAYIPNAQALTHTVVLYTHVTS